MLWDYMFQLWSFWISEKNVKSLEVCGSAQIILNW